MAAQLTSKWLGGIQQNWNNKILPNYLKGHMSNDSILPDK